MQQKPVTATAESRQARRDPQEPKDALSRKQRQRGNHQRDFQKHFPQIEAVRPALRARRFVLKILGLLLDFSLLFGVAVHFLLIFLADFRGLCLVLEFDQGSKSRLIS